MKSNKIMKMLEKQDNVLRPSAFVDLEEKIALVKREVSVKPVSGKESARPLSLFHHENLIHTLGNAKLIEKKSLANKLNHIHFMDGGLFVQLRHPKYDESVLVKAKPDPCLGAELICHFADENLTGIDLKKYEFLNLIIDDGQSVIFIPAVLNRMDKKSFSVRLPQESYAVKQRRPKRHLCEGVDAELVQGGRLIKGELLDFSPEGFRVKVSDIPSRTFDWSPAADVLTMVHLRRNPHVLFSGLCYCIRQRKQPSSIEAVLVPSDEEFKRSMRKQIRNPTQSLSPTPVIIFEHPFFGKSIQLEVSDISASGFSVYEEASEGVLIQGMIIPELTIVFAGALKMGCSAQVIYRFEEDEQKVICGFSILDMEINPYTQLFHILVNTLDRHAHISSKVDMDALWEFFFETGFIYPEKYEVLRRSRKRFKETYSKLYQGSPDISKHFTYQKNGRIYGHISMVRAYERAWMIHHHAGRSMEGKRAGFIVLKKIMHYLSNMHGLPSAKMDYVISYFRPENKFPDRVFGGFPRELQKPEGCSMDLFSYLLYPALSMTAQIPEGWLLQKCSSYDLWESSRFYAYHSGGLLWDILNLDHSRSEENSIESDYNKLGLVRKCEAYSLKFRNDLKAVLIVNQSDLGLNMSELLNGIKIMVTNPESLPWTILSVAIKQLTGLYKMSKIPIMIYPYDYTETEGVPHGKRYQLWILNVKYADEYIAYVRKRFRINFD